MPGHVEVGRAPPPGTAQPGEPPRGPGLPDEVLQRDVDGAGRRRRGARWKPPRSSTARPQNGTTFSTSTRSSTSALASTAAGTVAPSTRSSGSAVDAPDDGAAVGPAHPHRATSAGRSRPGKLVATSFDLASP